MIGLIDRALALNPSFAHGWYMSGALRNWAGQPDLAIEHVETSLRLGPRERMGVPRFVMGMAYLFKRQFDDAASKLLLSIQDDPAFPAVYRYLAACYAIWGGSTKRTRSSPAARHYPSNRAEGSAVAQPRGPRAVPVRPAPGGGRDAMSETRPLADKALGDVQDPSSVK